MLLSTAVLVVAGCSESTEPSTPTNTDPSITVSVGSGATMVARGSTVTMAVTVKRSGGYSGTIALNAEELPNGVTATFTPTSLSNTDSLSVLSLAVASHAVPVTRAINIRASGPGVVSKAAVISLTIGGGTPAIVVAASRVEVVTGASTSSSISVTRIDGFAGAVTLSLSGLPAQIGHSFSPASVTGSSSVLALMVAPDAPIGDHIARVTATAAGVATSTADFTVTVLPPSGSRNITYRFCNGEAVPGFFAFRDGNGAWTRVLPSAGNAFLFTLHNSVGSVAYASTTNGTIVTVLQYAADEFTRIMASQCNTVGTRSISGSVAGANLIQRASITIGGTTSNELGNGMFTLTGVPDGAVDVIASMGIVGRELITVSAALAKVFVRRGVNPVAGASIGLLDFGSAEALPAGGVEYSYPGTDIDSVLVANRYTTANKSSLVFGHRPQSAQGKIAVFGLPDSQTAPGDIQAVTMIGRSTDATGNSTERSVTRFARYLVGGTLVLGGQLDPPVFSSRAVTPYPRFGAAGSWQPEFDSFLNVVFEQANTAPTRKWQMFVSRRYLGTATTGYDVAIPDLSGVTGFSSNFGLRTGIGTRATVTAYSGLVGFTAFAEGTVFTSASFARTIAP